MQDPLTLKSGATLTVTLASFADANRLLKVVARELAAVSFDMDSVDFAGLSGKDINTLKNAIFQIVQSDGIEAVIRDCAKKCLYNGERIIWPNTFEPEGARQDYLPVAWEVMKANLSPFFAGLALSLSTNASPLSADPKSES